MTGISGTGTSLAGFLAMVGFGGEKIRRRTRVTADAPAAILLERRLQGRSSAQTSHTLSLVAKAALVEPPPSAAWGSAGGVPRSSDLGLAGHTAVFRRPTMSQMLHSHIAHLGLILAAIFLILVYALFRFAIR